MKSMFIVLATTLVAAFGACVIAQPFAWRLGSLPSVSVWLRSNLPIWLQRRLDRKGGEDALLCLRLLKWGAKVIWIAGLCLGLVVLVFAVLGIYS